MRISDWSSDVCSSDLRRIAAIVCQDMRPLMVLIGDDITGLRIARGQVAHVRGPFIQPKPKPSCSNRFESSVAASLVVSRATATRLASAVWKMLSIMSMPLNRSEEHTSELQSLMRISYAVFCLKKKKEKQQYTNISSTRNNKTKNIEIQIQ